MAYTPRGSAARAAARAEAFAARDAARQDRKQMLAENKAGQAAQATRAAQAALAAKNTPQLASTMQGRNTSIGTPTGTRGTLNNDMRGGPISGPGAPLPSNTPNPAIIPDNPPPSYNTPAGGNTSSIASGYNTGAPATTSYQGGTTGGMGGGMLGATGMPNTSMLPTGAAFKRGGVVRAKKMASGGMTSKVSTASKRADGIAQRGKTKGRMC
jgi:hypothetical protein